MKQSRKPLTNFTWHVINVQTRAAVSMFSCCLRSGDVFAGRRTPVRSKPGLGPAKTAAERRGAARPQRGLITDPGWGQPCGNCVQLTEATAAAGGEANVRGCFRSAHYYSSFVEYLWTTYATFWRSHSPKCRGRGDYSYSDGSSKCPLQQTEQKMLE